MVNDDCIQVLVIEDDADTRANIRDILELDGYRIVEATCCAEALDRENWAEISAILLDRKLPDGNGEQMLPRLRELAPHASIVIVTGFSDVEGAVTALRQGAHDYLLKPIDPNALRAELRRSIELHVARESFNRERHRAEHAERALQESESFTRSVLAMPVANIAVLDDTGTIIAVNDAWQAFARAAGDTALTSTGVGSNYFEVCRAGASRGDEIAAQAMAGMQAVLKGEQALFALEYPCDSPTQKRWFQMAVTPALGATGGLVVAHVSITERKTAEEALRVSEERMRAILNTAAEAIITIDRQGLVSSINRATEQMFGYTEAELVGQNVKVLMPPPYYDEHDGYIARYLDTGETRIIGSGREVVGRRKDGSTFPVSLAVSEIEHLGLFTGIVRDISAVKELQKQVLEIAAEQDRRIGHELHDNIQQQLTGLGLLARTVADRLDAAGKKNAGLSATAAMATSVAQGIHEAAKQVHLLSRGLVPVEIDAEGLRSALTDLASRITEQYGVRCDFSCEGKVEMSDTFVATHLYRIAQEAVNNAIKYGRPQRIDIGLKEVNETITLSVLDNGVGIDDKRFAGPGMGLRIMQYRAGLVGAALRIAPGEDQGTQVSCSIMRGGG